MNGKAATIVGVMPPNFKFPVSEELWMPLYNEFPPIPRGELRIAANNSAPAVMGRLKSGVTLDQANAEFIGSGQAFRPGISEDESKFHVGQRAAAVELDSPVRNFARRFRRCSAPSFSCC